MKLGLTLPSFVDDPAVPLAVAVVADRAGVDAVFAFDHLFRGPPERRRPALECTTLLGAVAAATRRVGLGSLVARSTLRPPAVLAHALDTVHRISSGRLLVGVGSGDEQSREENESYGLDFGTDDDRLASLHAAVEVLTGRGYPVWVGGRAGHMIRAGGTADGWNRWGVTPARLAAERDEVLAAHPGGPEHLTVSWGGLAVIGATEAEAEAKAARLAPGPRVLVGGPERLAEALAGYAAAGASWAVLGPIDSSDPSNAAVLGELVAPLVRDL